MLEWPTWAVLFVCYSAWFALTYCYQSLSLWVFVPLIAYVIGLHSSLQHEALHGHPTKNARINEALVFLPVGLFYPYRRFRDTHLAHHCDERLTDPYDDPESWFKAARDWQDMGWLSQALWRANATLIGRLLIGPALGFIGFIRHDFALLRAGDRRVIKAWNRHVLGLVLVSLWLVLVAGINPLVYLFLAAYPAASLLMVRTYAEHRAEEAVAQRTAIIESNPFFGLLFLNNNLHAVHHHKPRLPWYRLPAYYRAHRAKFVDEDQVDLVRGYRSIFRQHLFKARQPIVHPFLKRDGAHTDQQEAHS